LGNTLEETFFVYFMANFNMPLTLSDFPVSGTEKILHMIAAHTPFPSYYFYPDDNKCRIFQLLHENR
jgi:hypothetical protein